MNVTIREARREDFDGISAVFAQELQHHIRLLPDRFQAADPIMTPKWFGNILSNPSIQLFVADSARQIIGLVLIEQRQSQEDPIYQTRRYAYLDELAVAEKFRNQGVGARLMEAAADWAKKQGLAEIELNVWQANDGAVRFYERLGYTTFRLSMRKSIED